MVDQEEHIPIRPRWDCGTCGQPWPCSPAKVRLSEEYGTETTSLNIYLAQQMWSAIDDSYFHAKTGPHPIELRERFMGWVAAPVMNTPDPASRQCNNGGRPMNTPRAFALERDDNESTEIIGYGLTLPDGTALSVSWPAKRGSSIYSSSSAEETANLRGADLVWLD